MIIAASTAVTIVIIVASSTIMTTIAMLANTTVIIIVVSVLKLAITSAYSDIHIAPISNPMSNLNMILPITSPVAHIVDDVNPASPKI